MDDLTHLNLNENYDFEVTIEIDGTGYAATLHLNKFQCTLKVFGEEHSNRTCPLPFDDIASLHCCSFDNSFNLQGLRFTSGGSRNISYSPNIVGFYEYVFEVEFVLFIHCSQGSDVTFNSLSIFSSTFGEWIGHTHLQQEILEAYHVERSIKTDDENTEELRVLVNRDKCLTVKYNPSHEGDGIKDYTVGMSYHPSVELSMSGAIEPPLVFEKYEELYTLISFFIGGDFNIEKILLNIVSNDYSQGSMYFSSEKHKPRYGLNCIFYPLGKNLRFDGRGLIAIPECAFDSYFCMTDDKRSFFKKYRRYSRMDNLEERYLGYFRVLESLCSKQKCYLDEELLKEVVRRSTYYMIKKFQDKKSVESFLKSIPRLNKSKYNTEKCISDFYKEIPNEYRSEWKYGKNDIGSLCKLRNDITHANDYRVSTDDLISYIEFIEVLLVFALSRSLAISFEDVGNVIHRFSGYHLLRKEQE